MLLIIADLSHLFVKWESTATFSPTCRGFSGAARASLLASALTLASARFSLPCVKLEPLGSRCWGRRGTVSFILRPRKSWAGLKPSARGVFLK